MKEISTNNQGSELLAIITLLLGLMFAALNMLWSTAVMWFATAVIFFRLYMKMISLGPEAVQAISHNDQNLQNSNTVSAKTDRIDIQVEFEIKAGHEIRRYEAIGFSNDGESSIGGYTLFARIVANRDSDVAIGKENDIFLQQHFDQLPVELQPYTLITNSPFDFVFLPNCVVYYNWELREKGKWGASNRLLGDLWHGRVLVLRFIGYKYI